MSKAVLVMDMPEQVCQKCTLCYELVRANLPELCVAERTPNMRIEPEQTGQLRFA